jgi:hypothetical protein
MTNSTSMLPFRARAQAQEVLGVTGASPPADSAELWDPDVVALVVAILIMLAALQMLGRALAPLREALRAVASAVFAALLITSALILVLYATVSGHL